MLVVVVISLLLLAGILIIVAWSERGPEEPERVVHDDDLQHDDDLPEWPRLRRGIAPPNGSVIAVVGLPASGRIPGGPVLRPRHQRRLEAERFIAGISH